MSANAYGPDVEPVTEILVPLDRSAESEVALPAAAMLARFVGAHLYLLTVTDTASPDLDSYLDRMAHRLARPCTVEVAISPNPAEEIASRVRPGTAVCMMSHGRGRLGHMVFGSVTAQVVGQLREPVVVVGPHVPLVPRKPTRVLVPVDGSAFAEAALPGAAAWSSRLGVPIHLVSVVDPDIRSLVEGAGVPLDDVSETSYLAGLAHKLSLEGHHVTWDVLHGRHPAHAINDEADSVPGTVIAMSTHGRSGFSSAVAGSVTTRVVHHGGSPVIVLRPPDLELTL